MRVTVRDVENRGEHVRVNGCRQYLKSVTWAGCENRGEHVRVNPKNKRKI